MADGKQRERELRKNILRANMTVNQNWDKPEDREEKADHRRRRWLFILLAVFLIALFLIGYFWFRRNRDYTSAEEVWAVDMPDTNFSKFTEMNGGVVRYSRDGAAYYDSTGDMIWNQAYEMVSPLAAVNGDYLAIADQKGNALYLFGKNGFLGSAQTKLPISKVTIAGNGVAAVILEDASANYISLYASDGTDLDIEIKTVLAGDGYPIDISLSENGTILMASFAYLDQGIMQNKVIFYNFSEAGKNVVQRIVGGFQQYGDALVPDVEMLGQKAAVAFADDRISFYSLKNEISPELVQEVELSGELKSVFCRGNHVAVLLSSQENVNERILVLYDEQGNETGRAVTRIACTGGRITGEYLALYHEAECEIYTLRGHLRYAGPLSGTISYLAELNGTWIQIGGQEMKKIQFK